MDTERAEAVVLRVQLVTESSLIVTWFTREFGKLKTMAKGARRSKGPFRGKIDLFYLDEILFLRSRRSDLHLLHDCFLEKAHKTLRDSVPKLVAASYVTELIDLATEPEDANPKMFELLVAVLGTLERAIDDVVLIWFELQVLAVAGWAPKWDTETGTNKILKSLAGASLSNARRVRLSSIQAGEARRILWRHWNTHVGKEPRSRKQLMLEIKR